jgi:hypothetical protein
MYSLTPSGVLPIDPSTAVLAIVVRMETQKGNHVVDSQGRYLEPPILTSSTWDNPTGPDMEGR